MPFYSFIVSFSSVSSKFSLDPAALDLFLTTAYLHMPSAKAFYKSIL